ncbi:hypothetical protein Tco_1188552 [Tanacetum coccineum]
MIGNDEGFAGTQGLAPALEELPAATIVAYDNGEIWSERYKAGYRLGVVKVIGKKQQTQVSYIAYHTTYWRDYFVDFEEYDRGIILLGDGRECRIRGTWFYREDAVRHQEQEGLIVYIPPDGQQVTRNTLKGRKQLGEYQTGWKIKKGNVLDSCNQRSTQQCTKSKSGMSKVFWAEETTMSTYLVNRSPSSAIRFKTHVDILGFFGWLASIKQGMLEPVKVKCIFMGYRKGIVGTGSMQVLQGVEFEVEPQEDHTFEVEPHGNVDYVAEDNNEAAFVVAAVDKIYTRKSLTFNNTDACKVISKWKAGLKDDMDARSYVYMLSNGCKKCSDDSDGYYREYTPDKAKGNVLSMEIIKDQSGNTPRVSQSRFYNGKLVQTLLEGNFILSLEGSLSRDCDVDAEVFSTWMAFGGNTMTGDGVTGIKRCRRDLYSDGVRNLAMTAGRGPLKEDLESSTWRRRQDF